MNLDVGQEPFSFQVAYLLDCLLLCFGKPEGGGCVSDGFVGEYFDVGGHSFFLYLIHDACFSEGEGFFEQFYLDDAVGVLFLLGCDAVVEGFEFFELGLVHGAMVVGGFGIKI